MRQTSPGLVLHTIVLLLACGVTAVHSQAPSPSSLTVQPPGITSAEPAARARGQTLYVPVYSHIYYGGAGYGGKRRFFLAVTMSLRNTDLQQSMTITSARYYDTEGRLLQEYVTQPLRLGPLVSTSLFIERQDARGGSGANFIVEWHAEVPIQPPLVEAVMMGTAGNQALAFTSPSRVLSTHY